MNKLKKIDVITAISEKSGLTKADATRAYDALAEVIQEQVAAGNSLPVPGVGKIQRVEKGARNVRNPQTGETMQKPAYSAPRVTISKMLKDLVNGA